MWLLAGSDEGKASSDEAGFAPGICGATEGSKVAGLIAKFACIFPMRLDGSLLLNGVRPEESWAVSAFHVLFSLLPSVNSGGLWSFLSVPFFLVPQAVQAESWQC